jgi:hypothetical protein
MNHDIHPPELSVICITPDTFETLRRTIHFLNLQDCKERMEIVIVAPSLSELQADFSKLNDFCGYRVVEIGEMHSAGAAYASGIRHATAPVVALAEDHAFPQEGWAKALIGAHQQTCAAVGPAINNANPTSTISWVDLLLGYAPWLEPIEKGTMDYLPGHNSSYKRSILMEYGPKLEDMMESETILHWDLRTKGHQLYLEPRARTLHTNFGLPSSLIRAHFYTGRQFGASRAQNQSWSLPRKLCYSAAAPIIPFVRLYRILKDVRRIKNQKIRVTRVFLWLTLALMVDAIGQFTGYAFGAGKSSRKMAEFEFHRERHQKKGKHS